MKVIRCNTIMSNITATENKPIGVREVHQIEGLGDQRATGVSVAIRKKREDQNTMV